MRLAHPWTRRRAPQRDRGVTDSTTRDQSCHARTISSDASRPRRQQSQRPRLQQLRTGRCNDGTAYTNTSEPVFGNSYSAKPPLSRPLHQKGDIVKCDVESLAHPCDSHDFQSISVSMNKLSCVQRTDVHHFCGHCFVWKHWQSIYLQLCVFAS